MGGALGLGRDVWLGRKFLLGEVLRQLGAVEQCEKVFPHRDHRLLEHIDMTVHGRAYEIDLPPPRFHRRIVVPGMTAPALLAEQGRTGDALAHEQHVAQIQRQMPARIERPSALDAELLRT